MGSAGVQLKLLYFRLMLCPGPSSNADGSSRCSTRNTPCSRCSALGRPAARQPGQPGQCLSRVMGMWESCSQSRSTLTCGLRQLLRYSRHAGTSAYVPIDPCANRCRCLGPQRAEAQPRSFRSVAARKVGRATGRLGRMEEGAPDRGGCSPLQCTQVD